MHLPVPPEHRRRRGLQLYLVQGQLHRARQEKSPGLLSSAAGHVLIARGPTPYLFLIAFILSLFLEGPSARTGREWERLRSMRIASLAFLMLFAVLPVHA